MNKLYNSFAFLSKNSYYLCFGTKRHTMKKVKHEKSINLSNLLAEGLLTVVCEKNDLVWTVPFSVELHAQIVKELLSKFKISDS